MSNHSFGNPPQGANTPLAQSSETLYVSGERVLIPDAALVLVNTAVIFDHAREKLFARCIFSSIGDKEIRAVLVKVSCQDAGGSVLGAPFFFQYLDLKAGRGALFGQTGEIPLPDRNTRKASVAVKKVLLADGSVVTVGDLAFVLPEPVPLSKHFGSEALAAQYARETTPKARYVPERGNHYWCCTCGEISTNADEICRGCGCAREQVISALNPYQLQANMRSSAQEGQEQTQTAQETHSAENREKPEKTREKPIAAMIISLILVVALGCGAVFFGIPYLNYRSACKALENGKYDTAYETFTDLGDFMDSHEKANKALYEKARKALKNEDYASAVPLFQSLGSYQDSKDQLLEAKYLLADQYQNDAQYKEAYELYAELGSYRDSETELLDTIIFWEAAALRASTITDAAAFSNTVKLEDSHYDAFYSTLVQYLYSYENGEYWYDWSATMATRITNTMLAMLPSGYQDAAILQELFGLLTENTVVYDELFRDHETLVRACWDLPFVRDLAAQDAAVCYFLESYWTTSNGYYYMNFYENSNGGTTSDHTLPWVGQPYGTKYFEIIDMVYCWTNDEGPLAEVYRFEIIDYDTISVYCYQDNQTYTLYRD